MPLTKEDITNAVAIYFSHRGTKLWRNEPHLKKIKDVETGGYKWIVIKDIGYPSGSCDMMGWEVGGAITHGCEVKTVSDTLKPGQRKFLNGFVADGCIGFIAWGDKNDNINIYKWSDMKVVFDVIECTPCQ